MTILTRASGIIIFESHLKLVIINTNCQFTKQRDNNKYLYKTSNINKKRD